MSIGQRIAQKRKELGLSQEALGERLGVSRQAIYKWESDGALPEVEKLVQLSSQFGVSVGWLLGVEEEKAPRADGELTEQQLRMVEEIVGRYLAVQPKAAKRKRWVSLAAAVVLLALVWSLFARLEKIDDRYHNLQNSVNQITSNVNGQIGSISHQVEEMLKDQNLLTAEYGTEMLGMDLKNNSVRFSAYAVPKTCVEGMTAEFVADSGSGVTTLACMDAPQQKFSVEIDAELTDDIKLSVVFVHPDGKRETQLLDTYSYLLSATFPEIYVEDFHLFGMAVEEGALTLKDFYVNTHGYSVGKGGTEIVSIRVGLFRNQKLLAWAEPCEQPENYQGYEAHEFYRVPDMEVKLGRDDSLQAAAFVKDSFGREFMVCEVPYVVQYETDFGDPYLTYPPVAEYDKDPAKWEFDMQ